jgi:two-component system C4-dicarboxylate transport sensor histidine kinase DctB
LLERERTQEVGENLRRIAQLTERIGAITSELRNFARRKPAKPRPLKVGTAIDGALLLVGDMLRAAGLTLERAGDEALKVVGDRVRLEQILINLLQNAAEAVRDREDRRVRISVMPGAQVAIDVADSGPGVPSDFADQLFAPFATGREEGLGLGLAIARGIARDLGGDLILSQSPLGGAAFRLTLPAA